MSGESSTPPEASGSRPSFHAWFMVGLLWMVAVLNYLDRIVITTMRDSLMEVVPMSDAQFGLLTSAFLWVYGLLSPLAGFLADRFSRTRMIVVSLLAWSTFTWLTGHAETFEQLLVVRALMGLSEAAYLPAALSLIADYHRGSTRSLATGIHMTGFSVGSGLGGLGGWLAEKHGWQFAFNVFGFVGIGYALLIAFCLRDPVPDQDALRGGMPARGEGIRLGAAFRHLFGSGSFVLLIVFWSLLAVTGWAVVGWMPTHFKEQFSLGQGMAGISATAYLYTAMLLGKLVGGVWADRWSLSRERARILVAALGLLIAAPAILLVAHTNLFVVAIIALSVYGLTRTFTDANLMPILCQVADARYRATGYGIINMFGTIVGGLTVYAGGAMRDANISLASLFQWAAAGTLACAVLMLFVKPRRVEISVK